MRRIQDIYKCLYFTPDENLNKTCMDKKRCSIYYDETCPDYFEVSQEYKLKQQINKFKSSISKFYEENSE